MRLKLLSLMVAALFLGACSATNDPSGNDNGNDESESAPPTVSVSVKSLAEIDELIASHQGKVVVVDLWALW